jgi:hypothetical protein
VIVYTYVNSTGGTDDYIQGLASDWTWYIELITYGFALLDLLVLGPLNPNRLIKYPAAI